MLTRLTPSRSRSGTLNALADSDAKCALKDQELELADTSRFVLDRIEPATQRLVARLERGAAVAWRDENLLHPHVLGQLPCERMLAPPRSDDEKLHVSV